MKNMNNSIFQPSPMMRALLQQEVGQAGKILLKYTTLLAEQYWLTLM